MKSMLALAAALAAFATSAVAQQPAAQPAAAVPPMTCKAADMPGERMMEDPAIRRRFERDMKTYGDCVKAYVAERQAAVTSLQQQVKAHSDAGNQAVADYNALMKKMNEAQGAK